MLTYYLQICPLKNSYIIIPNHRMSIKSQILLTQKQKKQKYQNRYEQLWQALSNHSQNMHPLQPVKVNQIQDLLSQILQLPRSFELNLIIQRLGVLIKILTIERYAVRLKTLEMLSQVLQNMPNFAIYFFLQHSCFWILIHNQSICKEEVSGYCKLIITLFQHRQKITNQNNLNKIIDLIPFFCQYESPSLIIKLSARLVSAIECQNEDKNGLCLRIYCHFNDNKSQKLTLIQQLQMKYRLNTSKLFKKGDQLIQMILQTLQNQTYSNSSLQLLFLFLKREQMSQALRKYIINNFVSNFERSNTKMKSIILRIVYALYESQFHNWYFRRDQTRTVIQHLINLSINALSSKEHSLLEMVFNKIHRYLNGSCYTQQYKIRAIFFKVISQPPVMHRLRQVQGQLDLQLSKSIKILIEIIKQDYSDTSYTQESLNQLEEEMSIKKNEIQEESSPQLSYSCSDSYL